MISAIGAPLSYLYRLASLPFHSFIHYIAVLNEPRFPPCDLARRHIEPIHFRKRDEIQFNPASPPRRPINRSTVHETALRVNALATIPNGGNTCFFAALTQAFLAVDPQILEAFHLAVDKAEGNDKRALLGIFNYLKIYRSCQLKGIPVPREITNQIRESLALLGLEGRGPVQQDPEEALMVIMGKLLGYLPEDTAIFHTRIWTASVLDDIATFFSWLWSLFFGKVPVSLGSEERVIDAANKIFWEPPEPNFGKIELSFDARNDFSSMIQRYFFENKSRQDERLRRLDHTGQEKEFRFVSKRKVFEKAPERLTISFKRFDNHRKINSHVQGIGEELELRKEYFLDNTGGQYRIDGVVIHQGPNRDGGHYYALRRTIDENGIHSYILADDAQVFPLSQQEFQKYLSQSYILFYKKI